MFFLEYLHVFLSNHLHQIIVFYNQQLMESNEKKMIFSAFFFNHTLNRWAIWCSSKHLESNQLIIDHDSNEIWSYIGFLFLFEIRLYNLYAGRPFLHSQHLPSIQWNKISISLYYCSLFLLLHHHRRKNPAHKKLNLVKMHYLGLIIMVIIPVWILMFNVV